ncbi:uncharacterized protein LOC132301233 [Cornus florida]|uniref:uncharacterized protein LOC132301233 n=1 Tax=Cornus florida TaxID=4283 RepID=UPI00289C1FD3|nr:uncharacterized protein LOC132301233 [Cornus florida]
MVTSTPYYAQGNGQAEASNKVVIEIIEKMIKDKPRRTIPYRLTFGHDAVLPIELNVKSERVALQHNVIPADYNEAMLAELEDLDEVQKLALDHLMVHKAKVMRAYNKIVEFKLFADSDMVWQTILPPGKVDRDYGKWSPTWKGPYLVNQVLHGGAYRLKDLNGEIHDRPINGRYLKKYKPIIFELMEEKKIPVSQDSVDCILCKLCKDKICSCDK